MKRGQLNSCQKQFSTIYSERQWWIFEANSQSCSAQYLPVHLQWSFSKRPEWFIFYFIWTNECTSECKKFKTKPTTTKENMLLHVMLLTQFLAQRITVLLLKLYCFTVYLLLIVFCLSLRQWWRHILHNLSSHSQLSKETNPLWHEIISRHHRSQWTTWRSQTLQGCKQKKNWLHVLDEPGKKK